MILNDICILIFGQGLSTLTHLLFLNYDYNYYFLLNFAINNINQRIVIDIDEGNHTVWDITQYFP